MLGRFYLNDYCTNDFLRTAAIRVVNIPVNELIKNFFFSISCRVLKWILVV